MTEPAEGLKIGYVGGGGNQYTVGTYEYISVN